MKDRKKEEKQDRNGIIFWTVAMTAILGVFAMDYVKFNLKRIRNKVRKKNE